MGHVGRASLLAIFSCIISITIIYFLSYFMGMKAINPEGRDITGQHAMIVTTVAFGAFVGLGIIQLLIGLPIHFALKRFQKTTWIWYAFSGLIVGILISRPWMQVDYSLNNKSLHTTILICALGAQAGFVFWWFGVRDKNG